MRTPRAARQRVRTLDVLRRTCPSGKSGGSLGEFGPGQMVKEFNDVVFTTGTVGKVSPLPCATLRVAVSFDFWVCICRRALPRMLAAELREQRRVIDLHKPDRGDVSFCGVHRWRAPSRRSSATTLSSSLSVVTSPCNSMEKEQSFPRSPCLSRQFMYRPVRVWDVPICFTSSNVP